MALTENKNVHTVEGAAAPVTLWIDQITAGDGFTYDLATHHKITFKEGTKTSYDWNGLTDITVQIPTLEDLIQDPIKLAGTVDKTGIVTPVKTGTYTPAVGDLIYVTEDCTFNGVACEAGDMAIYTGSGEGQGWKVVSGENQVTIVAGTAVVTEGENKDNNVESVSLTTSLKKVLTVEGKTLALKLDEASVAALMNTSMGVLKNAYTANNLAVTATPNATNVVLTKTAGTQKIGNNKDIFLPKSLTNGAVTFSNGTADGALVAVTADTIKGAFGNATKAAVTDAGTVKGVTLNTVDATGTDFVTGWTDANTNKQSVVTTAIKDANFKIGDTSSKSVSVLQSDGTYTKDETAMVVGIHKFNADTDKDGDNYVENMAAGFSVTIPGAVSVETSTVEGDNNRMVTGVTFPTIGDADTATNVGTAEATAAAAGVFLTDVKFPVLKETATAIAFTDASAAADGVVVSNVVLPTIDDAKTATAIAFTDASAAADGVVVSDVTLPTLDYTANTACGTTTEGTTGDFISSIDTNVTVSIKDDTNKSYDNVMTNASVDGHVLTFSTAAVSANLTNIKRKSATYDKAKFADNGSGSVTYKNATYLKQEISNTPSVTYKNATYKLSSIDNSDANKATKSFAIPTYLKQVLNADSNVAFGKLSTADSSTVNYTLDTHKSTAAYQKATATTLNLTVAAAEDGDKASVYKALPTLTKGKYTINLDNAKVDLAADKVVTSASIIDETKVANTTYTGTVGTDLTLDTTATSVGYFDATNGTVEVDNSTYAISKADTLPTDLGENVSITSAQVAAATQLENATAAISIPAGTFVTDVVINESGAAAIASSSKLKDLTPKA